MGSHQTGIQQFVYRFGQSLRSLAPLCAAPPVYERRYNGSPLLAFASSLQQVETAMTRPGASTADIKKAVEAANTARKTFIKSHNARSDQNIVAAVLQMYYNEVPKDQQPQGLYTAIRNEYGALDKESTYQKICRGHL